MKNLLLAGIMIFAVHEESWARGWELAFLAGWTAPTYEQTFEYTPDVAIPSPFSGVDVQQQGTFTLKARGNFAFGGGATYYFNDRIGIEGRIDTVDVRIDTLAPRFVATAAPSGLAPVSAELNLGTGNVDVERLFPLSVNLKARFGEGTRFIASGGLSYLPRLRFTATQTVGLGVTSFRRGFDIATTDIRAAAAAGNEGQFGLNGGAGVEYPINDSITLVGEGRLFWFQSRSFEWRLPSGPTSIVERLLQQQLQSQLQPVNFGLAYFQVTGGIVVRLK